MTSVKNSFKNAPDVLRQSKNAAERVFCTVIECLSDMDDIHIKAKLERVGNKMLSKIKKSGFVSVTDRIGEAEYDRLTKNRTKRLAERFKVRLSTIRDSKKNISEDSRNKDYSCDESHSILQKIDVIINKKSGGPAWRRHSNTQTDADRETVRKFYENPSPTAFALLWDRFKFGVHSHIAKIIGDWERAEDLVQETFARAWEKKFMYDPEMSNFSTWLYTIARNITFTQLKKDAKDRTIDVDVNDVYASSLQNNTDNTYHTDDSYYIINDDNEIETNSFEDVSSKIYDASVSEIRTMDPLFQQIFEMKNLKDMTLRQIAAQMGMTESKVKNCYYKNREILEVALREKYNDLYVNYQDASHDRDEEESLYY